MRRFTVIILLLATATILGGIAIGAGMLAMRSAGATTIEPELPTEAA